MRWLTILVTGIFLFSSQAAWSQGDLDPAGAPGPTFKTLQQVEPRIPIDSLPYPIISSGSYYLMGSLVGQSGFGGISISADNVTVDLNGYSLLGQPGSYAGIAAVSVRQNIVVRNGCVANWGWSGVDLLNAHNSQVLDLQVSGCVLDGICVGRNSRVERCAVMGNGGEGIVAQETSQIAGCTAANNTNNGITAAGNCVVADCTVRGNGGDGISGGTGVTVRSCSAQWNQHGIKVESYSSVSGCTTFSNRDSGVAAALYGSTVSGTTAFDNHNVGFELGLGSTIVDCTAHNNSFGGIEAPYGCVVRGCSLWENRGNGMWAGSNSTVEAVSAMRNEGHGIRADSGVTIRGCSAGDNAGDGIRVGRGAAVLDCTAFNNATNGIVAGDGSTISRCNTYANGVRSPFVFLGDGMHLGAGCVVKDSSSKGNDDDGLQLVSGTVSDSSFANNGYGLYVTERGSRIVGNTFATNRNYGIYFQPPVATQGNYYAANVFIGGPSPVGESGINKTGTYGNVNIFLP